jgi:hypothetical protein
MINNSVFLIVTILALFVYYVKNNKAKVIKKEHFCFKDGNDYIPNGGILYTGSNKESVKDLPKGYNYFNYKGNTEHNEWPSRNKNRLKKVIRKDQLDAQLVDKRLPSIIKQKYQYNDVKETNNYLPVLEDMARLKELPTDIKTRYHALLDKETAYNDYLYNPDILNGKQFLYKAYDGQILSPKRKKFIQGLIKAHTENNSNTACGCLQCKKIDKHIKSVNSAHICGSNDGDPPVKMYNRATNISGFNRSDILPANYADRSKESVEIYAGSRGDYADTTKAFGLGYAL